MDKTAMPTRRTERAATTPFSCCAPDAQEVFLTGDFNGWDPTETPMAKGAGGDWDVALALPSGTHEFKFVVDGQWCCEPGCDSPHGGCTKCVANTFGTMNRIIEVV